MYGQTKKYRKSLKQTPEPIMPSQITQQIDLKGIMEYSKISGKKVIELTDAEKQRFIKK